MCGIAGIVRFGGKVHTEEIQKMNHLLRHRGPDGEGIWINEQQTVGLGHRRLSIIDLSENAAQPMRFANRYSITYNGEIYNYKELREELIKTGQSFKSTGDTEVLLALYQKHGEKMLEKLDGMFAFAIWDEQEQKLFCARDRFGEKPFFYYQSNDAFYFASEMKALFGVGITAEIDLFMVSNFLVTDLVVNPAIETQTFYKNIKKLPKAQWIKVDYQGKLTTCKYYSVNRKIDNINLDTAKKILFDHLIKSVDNCMTSDVQIGSTLSGGIDSTIIHSLISESYLNHSENLKNKLFSARFNDQGFSENHFIDIVSKEIAGDYKSVFPTFELITHDLEKIFYHQEEPFWSASMLNHFAVMRLASESHISVLLEGQGADEILAGYPWHNRIYLQELHAKSDQSSELKGRLDLAGKIKKSSPRLHGLLHTLKVKLRHNKILRSRVHSPWSKILDKSFINCHGFDHFNYPIQKPILNDVLYADLNNYYIETLVRIGDRNSMAFSIETRLPFLNHHLVDFCFSLPAEFKINQGWQKFVLRKAFENKIPDAICWRKDKMGFAPPQQKWLEHPETVKLIDVAIQALQDIGWIRIKAKIPPAATWKILMLYSLYKFSKTDFSKC
ncbi:MAG: asparagine synthase (glutamine-hydrolyzing) [Crocinitomicaceae bacterium]|nr:asparagine synthase (glutamine-hydrolyzing) [Crocinitomicaceae bacterium]MBK8926135.1 asparagine synthase (glutamine-hydrolyzing) [Crocinitomicaceae bacterium]